MSHFARIVDSVVDNVIVAEQDFIDTLPDKDKWLQTSYGTHGNVHYSSDGQPDGGTPFRGNFAGVGFIYDAERDVFYPPKPAENAVLNIGTWLWEVPETKAMENESTV